MFEFLTGQALFALMVLGRGQQEKDDADDHLIQLNDMIRPLPDWMMEAWPRAGMWYGPDRQRLQPYSDEEPYIHGSIDECFMEKKSPEIDDEEAEIVVS